MRLPRTRPRSTRRCWPATPDISGRGPAWLLATLGWTAAALDDYDRAAVLMGAADRHLQRIGIDTTRLALLATLGETAAIAARAALGAAAYSAARKRGTRLDYQAAVAAALADDPLSPKQASPHAIPDTINRTGENGGEHGQCRGRPAHRP